MHSNVPKLLLSFRPAYDGDVIDRCINYYTTIVLFAATALISAKQYIGLHEE